MRTDDALKVIFCVALATASCAGRDGGVDGDGLDTQCVVPIAYHGGPVIHGTFNIYYVWYGNWSGNTAMQILPDLASNIGGSPHYNINTTYYDDTGTHVSNSVAYGGSVVDSYSRGSTITADDVKDIVADAIKPNKLPKDENGLYFVLSSADVNESTGFCTDYCARHDHAQIKGAQIKYAFVGNPDRCKDQCLLENKTVSPNGNPGADGMAASIVHELNGAATDPLGNAWYFNANHFENGDQCAWTYGTTVPQPNGSSANVTLGTRNYLLQRNWVNDGCGHCAISYP